MTDFGEKSFPRSNPLLRKNTENKTGEKESLRGSGGWEQRSRGIVIALWEDVRYWYTGT
jgi:hypothetical protein